MNSIADLTAFGEMPIAPFDPLCSWAFTYNINPGLVKSEIVGTGTVTHDGNVAKASTGTDANGSAKVETIRSSRYIPGMGGRALFTAIFSEPQENSKMAIGPMNSTDGWAIGYNGTRFGVCRKSLGVEEWFYTAENGQELGSRLNPQKGNVFQIRYQWLGFGVQRIYIENNVGELGLEMNLFYVGKYDVTSIDNANLPLSMCAVNDGNTTDIWISSPSAVLGLEGNGFNDANSVNIAADSTKTSAVAFGTNYPVLAFRMEPLYLTKANRLFAQALGFLASTDCTKTVTFRAYAGATITGGAWSYISEPLAPLEVNTTFTSISGGVLIGTFPLGKTDSTFVEIVSSLFRLYAGQSVALVATSTGSGDIVAGVNWKQFL